MRKNLQSIREALESIYTGLEEAETALKEGQEQLEKKNTEARTSHTEAREELDEGARELQEAWDQLISWEGYTPLRNEFLIWFDEDVTDRYAVLKDMEATLDVNMQKSELFEDSNVKAIIDDSLDPLWSMSIKKFFSIQSFIYTFNWGILAISGVAFVLLSVVAVGISSRAINQVQPAEAISKSVSTQPKIGRAARKMLHRVEQLSKFSLLSLRRNPFRFFASVISMSGAVCMIFGALSFIVAKNEVLTQECLTIS